MPRVAARSQRFDFLSGVQEDLGRESKLRMFTLRVRFREKRLNSARGIDFFPSSLFVPFLMLEETCPKKNE